MDKIDLFIFSLPFKKPVVIRNQTLMTREGLFMRSQKRGIISEASPLYGFSKEILNEAIEEIFLFFHRFSEVESLEALKNVLINEKFSSSACFAIYSFYYQHLASKKQSKKILSRRFFSHESPQCLKQLLLSLDKEQILPIVVKIKTSLYPFKELLTLLHDLKKRLVFIKLQLDFNCSLSLEQGKILCDSFHPDDFFSLEDPLKQPEELYNLSFLYKHPLSLDESHRRLSIEFFHHLDTVKTFEFKPSFDFPLLLDQTRIQKILEKKITLSFSSAYETPIGLSLIPNVLSSLYSHSMYGLDTAHLFDPEYLKNINLPQKHSCCRHYAQVELPHL